MRTNAKPWRQDVQCQWIWMPRTITLNDKAEEKWLWTSKERKCNDSKCLNEYAWRLWTPKTEEKLWHQMPSWIMALKAKMKAQLWMPNWKCDSEFQTKNVALNAKQKKYIMTLNVELKTNNNSECQTKNMALNAKLKIWLWTLNWRRYYGSDVKLKMNNDSKCLTEDAALNAKMKIRFWTSNQAEDVTLNIKWKKNMMALNAKLEINNDSKRQTKDMALNAKLNNMAMNAKLSNVALTTKLKQLWTPSCEEMMRWLWRPS